MVPSHREIEIKLRVSDLREIRARLRRLGARAGKRVREVNTLYDSPGARLRARGELLRLRLNDGVAVVTHKGPAQKSPRGAGQYKARRETEFDAPDPARVRLLLQAAGLIPGMRYEKYRTAHIWPRVRGVQVVLDETPIGPFLELEGAPQAIDRAARLLGYGPADYITSSYLALYFEDCHRRGRKPSDMLFPRRKKSKKASVLR